MKLIVYIGDTINIGISVLSIGFKKRVRTKRAPPPELQNQTEYLAAHFCCVYVFIGNQNTLPIKSVVFCIGTNQTLI